MSSDATNKELCIRCCRPLGSYRAHFSGDGPYCEACAPHHLDKPGPLYGWTCPACGRGNAPWKSQCDCTPAAISSNSSSASIGG